MGTAPGSHFFEVKDAGVAASAVKPKNHGFTLVELLVSIAILSIIMTGFYQITATVLANYTATSRQQALVCDARLAMERMVRFARTADAVAAPADGGAGGTLSVTERMLDHYDNATRQFNAAGDGLLDADNDGDGQINEDGLSPDPPEYVTFDLDTTDPDNWRLQEQLPDYATAVLDDFMTKRDICEHVTEFACKRSGDLIEIRLSLENNGHAISLLTRVRAGRGQ